MARNSNEYLRRVSVRDWFTPAPSDPRRETSRSTIRRAVMRKASAVGLSPLEIDKLMARLPVLTLTAGERFVSPGDSPDFVHVVGTGAVKTVIPWPVGDTTPQAPGKPPTSARWLTVQYAKPGYIFGLTPLPGTSAPSRFGAIAHCDSRVTMVSRDLLVNALEKTPPEMQLQLLAYHARGMGRLIASMCQRQMLDVPGRIEHILVELARAFPRPGHPGAIALDLTQDDLADFAGCHRLAVHRALARSPLCDSVERVGKRYVVNEELLRKQAAPARQAPPLAGWGEVPTGSRLMRSLDWMTRTLRLPRSAVGELVDGARLYSYAAEERLALGPPLSASVLVSGSVRVLVDVGAGDECGVWFARPGQFISTGSFHDRSSSEAEFRSVAHEDCEVAVFTSDVLTRAIAKMRTSELLRFLGHLHAALSRHLYQRCVGLALSAAESLLVSLQVLANDFGVRHAEGTVIRLPLPKLDVLRPFVATSSSTFRRAVAALFDAGRLRHLTDGSLLVVGYATASSAA